jgi:reactive intermediate/imine deaminase
MRDHSGPERHHMSASTMRSVTALLALVLAGTAPLAAQTRETTEYHPVPGERGLPFSEAVRTGNLLFLSGQLGTDASQKLVPGGIKAETRQALENIRAVLERHGSSLDRVVKCTAMLADMQEWAAMNEVYVTFFPQHLPARSAFGTTGLALNARLELECIATVGT